jgi:type III pantothenate kinase
VSPDVVVDVGNSRIKWGLCRDGWVSAVAALPADDPQRWHAQLNDWATAGRLRWAVAGVHPQRRDAFAAWARSRGDEVWVLDSYRHLPLTVRAEPPERVGIDRLLNVLAARSRLPAGTPAVVVDAGSAVTVNLLDADGAFGGGAIFPGLRLMARALHEQTAALPLSTVRRKCPEVPARSTEPAIEAGIFWAAAGGIDALVRQTKQPFRVPVKVFLTGGDALLLSDGVTAPHEVVPELTLDGIRLAAESLPG